MKCIDFDHDDNGRRRDCTAESTGKHGLCEKHLKKRIRWIKQEIAEDENYMQFYLNDAKAHKRFGNHRSNVIARVRDARYFGHRVLRLRRDLRRLEAPS